MTILIAAIIILVVIVLLVWAEGLLPIDARVVQLLQAATVIIGALIILQRVGLV